MIIRLIKCYHFPTTIIRNDDCAVPIPWVGVGACITTSGKNIFVTPAGKFPPAADCQQPKALSPRRWLTHLSLELLFYPRRQHLDQACWEGLKWTCVSSCNLHKVPPTRFFNSFYTEKVRNLGAIHLWLHNYCLSLYSRV